MEPPSANDESECMSQRKPTPRKGKAPASSSEPVVVDHEPLATPSLVICTSTLRPQKRKREDEKWHFALMTLQRLSL